MFANKLAFIALLAATVVSASTEALLGAIPTGVWDQTTEKCSVGELKCCNNIQSVQSAVQQGLFGPINGALGSLTGQAGFNCNPISGAIGASGNNCNASPACCSHSTFNGIAVLGCSPINGNA